MWLRPHAGWRAEWLNRTINIDTDASLAASSPHCKYPEKRACVSSIAANVYAPAKPFLPEPDLAPPLSAQTAT